MLRASIDQNGEEADVTGIGEGAKAGDAGIEHGQLLTAFVDAALSREEAALDTARDALRDAAGSAALVDAAAVIGNFERMVRIADGTGIPLDGMVKALSGDIREELGLDEFRSRRISGGSGRLLTAFAPALRKVAGLAMRFAGRRSGSAGA